MNSESGTATEVQQNGIRLENVLTTDGTGSQNGTCSAVGRNAPARNEAPSDKQLKFQIYGNLVVLCAAFLVYFVGISPLNTIQISMDINSELRATSLGVHTATMLLQALFFNSLFIDKLNHKRAILVGTALEIVFVGANMHTRWWTLVPAAFVAGLGRPLMRTAALVYIVQLAHIYEQRLKKSKSSGDGIKWKFFSVYFIVCACAGVIGNIVLSVLFLDMGFNKFSLSQLKYGRNEERERVNSSYEEFQFCGTNFCDKKQNSTLLIIDALHDYEAIHFRHVHELCGFSLGSLIFSSLIVLLFLQPLNEISKTGHNDDDRNRKSSWHHLLDTMGNWKHPKQILLIPILLYNGMDNSFFAKDFAKSFVTCVFGIQITGFAIAWFGFSALLSVFVFSLLLSNCRPIPLVIAFCVHLAGAVTLFSLNAANYDLKKMFILTVTWGIGSGLWQFCIAVFTGIAFANRVVAAFSNYSLFNTLGATLNYAWSYHLCTGVKINILISLLIVGFAGYVTAEMLLKRQRKKH